MTIRTLSDTNVSINLRRSTTLNKVKHNKLSYNRYIVSKRKGMPTNIGTKRMRKIIFHSSFQTKFKIKKKVKYKLFIDPESFIIGVDIPQDTLPITLFTLLNH